MKVNQLNTRDASNIPRKMHLRDPFSGEIMRDDDDRTVDFWIYGMQSDAARNAIRAIERKYGASKDRTQEQAQEAGCEYLAELTQGWSDNLEDDNGPIKFSREAAVQLYREQDWIGKQVSEFAANLRNYDPKR